MRKQAGQEVRGRGDRERIFASLSRRAFLNQTARVGAALAIPSLAAKEDLPVHGSGDRPLHVSGDLIFNSATDLARLIRDKAVSSEEVVRAHLARIEAVNPRLNAVCTLDAEGAIRAARAADAALARGLSAGPLHGVPLTVKDSFDTVGMISTGGTTGRSKFIPAEDATVVARVRAAGAVVMGKTNTPELTLSYETDNLLFGRTNNPFDLARTSGGSSGGAAAILAAGGAPLEIGSDTAGSIRIPAAFCGVAGLKPTFGRVSRAGNILPPGGVVGRRTHAGPMARFVEDLALLLSILSGTDARDSETVPVDLERMADARLSSMRVAFFTANGKSQPVPSLVQAVQSAAAVLSAAGASVEEKCIPGFQEGEAILGFLNYGDGGDYYRKLLKQYGTTRMHPETAAYLEKLRSGVISGRKYSDVLLDWGRLKETALAFMKQFQLLIAPVCSGTAPLHGGTAGQDFSYSYFFNLLGWPTAVVRVGKTAEGLPLSVQVAGRPWKDHEVLAAAFRLEQALGGWKRDFPEKTGALHQVGQ